MGMKSDTRAGAGRTKNDILKMAHLYDEVGKPETQHPKSKQEEGGMTGTVLVQLTTQPLRRQHSRP